MIVARLAFAVVWTSWLLAGVSALQAGPFGLLPSKKNATYGEAPVRSIYSRGEPDSQASYQPVARSSKKPGIFKRMGQGTKNFFGATKDAVTFKKKSPAAPVSGKTSSWTPKKTQQKREGSSWFGSWFKKKEDDRPKTMKDWMKQDRVTY